MPPSPPVVRTPRTPDDVAQVQMKAIVNHLADVVKGGGSLDAVSAKMLSAQFPEVSATFRSKAMDAAKNVAQKAPNGSDVSEFIRSFATAPGTTIASVAGAATIQAMVGAGGQLHDTGTGQFVSPDDPQVRIKRMRNATSNIMRSR